jgi:hypothetical protein
MGYHIILVLEARIKPEFKDFLYFLLADEPLKIVTKDIFNAMSVDDKRRHLPDMMKDFQDIWIALGINSYFHELQVVDDVLQLRIEKKPFHHSGFLPNDYFKFTQDIIVPMTFEITNCNIEHDDYEISPTCYTDDFLRNI